MTSSHDSQAQPGDQPDNLQQRGRQSPWDGHSHNHAHSHSRLRHTHNHLHNTPDSADQQEVEKRALHDQSHQDPIEKRKHVPPYYTHVIQTLSLIYGTDADGKPSIQTIAGPPATVVVDSQTGETVAAISAQDDAVTPPAPAPEPAASEPPQFSVPVTAPAAVTTSTTSQPPNTNTLSSSVESSTNLISPPSTSASTVDLAHHSNNATNTPLSVDSSNHLKTNTTMMRAFDFTTTPFGLTSTTSRSTIISSTTLSSYISSSTTISPSSTGLVGGGGLTGGEEDAAQPTTESDSNNEPLSPREKQIVGGVVGSVAGAAFFILLIMLALRYKKRKQAHLALEDNDGPPGSRGITQGGGSGGEAAMSQRSSMPTAVAAAMASLTGKRKPQLEPAPEGERGFYRVSGRKLQSVLQTGGDGYADPHDSVASGTSDYYRGSQAFDRREGTSGHLTLGSPMRPVSGVMVMRDGPGRTPVTAQNPFADPPSPPPTRGPGTLGRSLASQDGSGASGSRFREGI